jgi:hypothetical protein
LPSSHVPFVSLATYGIPGYSWRDTQRALSGRLLQAAILQGMNLVALLKITYRTSLSGSPGANALNETCSSRVTYWTSLLESQRTLSGRLSEAAILQGANLVALLIITYRTSLSGSPGANALNETCSSRVTYRTFLLGSPRTLSGRLPQAAILQGVNLVALLRVTYRTSLSGSPRADALDVMCSSRVTYRTSLLGSPRALSGRLLQAAILQGVNLVALLIITCRTSLSGSPRADALKELCSSRVTYRSFLLGSPRALSERLSQARGESRGAWSERERERRV